MDDFIENTSSRKISFYQINLSNSSINSWNCWESNFYFKIELDQKQLKLNTMKNHTYLRTIMTFNSKSKPSYESHNNKTNKRQSLTQHDRCKHSGLL